MYRRGRGVGRPRGAKKTGRGKAVGAVNREDDWESVQTHPRNEDAASVKTAKSQKAVQREKILVIEDQMALIEDQITQLEVKQRAAITDLQKRKDEAIFKFQRLKEEFGEMDRVDPNYKAKRLEVVNAEFEAKKLQGEYELMDANQNAEKRILQNKLKSMWRQAENERLNLEEIVEEETERKDKTFSVVSMNSEEKRKQTEFWVNQSLELEDPEKVQPSPPKAVSSLERTVPQMTSSTEKTLCKILARQSIGRDFPNFGGEAERWPRFKMEFVRISEECGFSDAEKMSKLEKCLKGEALKAVQSLMTAPKNIGRVMLKLEQLFGKTDLVINALIDNVRKTPPIKEHKLDTLVEFGIAVGSLSATIEALGDPTYLTNPYLVRELVDKLPRDFKLRWSDWIDAAPERKNTLQCFSSWIDIQTEKIRDFGLMLPSTSFIEKKKELNGKKIERVHATGEQKMDSKKKSSCNVCSKEGHWANQCRMFQNKSLEERKKVCEEKRLCHSCLIPGHRMSECRRKKVCGENGCQEYHHNLLHRQRENVQTNSSQQQEVSHSVVEIQNRVNSHSGVIMGALPVIIKGPAGAVRCLAFIDNGSSVTLLDEEVAVKTGLSGQKQPFCMKTLTCTKQYQNSRNVDVTIRGDWPNSRVYNMTGLRTVDELPLTEMKQDGEALKKTWPYLRNIPIPSFNEKPKLLIGNGHCFLTASRQMVGLEADQPMAFKSRLGWSVGGQQTQANLRPECFFHICENEQIDDDLHQMIKKSFSVEDFIVKVTMDKPRSREDSRALEIMKNTTVRVEDGIRLQTGLLWKNESVRLPESKKMAIQRLKCQERKMDRDPEFAEAYCKKIDEYLEKGFIRKLEPSEIESTSPRLWYLPHFGVIKPNKPGKIRLVFDAASKSHGVSLNSVLSMGPDLNNPLLSVLWKFRKHEVAVVGDIKDMFHRVFIQPQDRVSQRFLWRGTRRDIAPEEYEMLVMIFGATCSPSSAQFAKNLNAEMYAKEYPEACEAIKKLFYVDDFLHSSPTVDEAMKIVKDVTYVQALGGFEVCNWVSNSKEVMMSIPEELRAKSILEIDLERDDLPSGRVLGLWWIPATDEFSFKLIMHRVPLEVLTQMRRPTKREVLKVVMSLYDPLGFVNHLTLKGKIMQQDVWRSGIGWDDEIPTSLSDRWKSWINELRRIEDIRIPRCYSRNLMTAVDISLQVFCDASEKAFSAVAFFRIESSSGVEISFVSSKTRVTPLKPQSIPRLELMAAVMATRLSNCIVQEIDLKINNVTFWTDSMTVLRWIRSDARTFKPFIAHRLGEILETTDVIQWRYVPTKLNVADDGTRDTEPADLSRESRWFCGPSFLKEDRSLWPEDVDMRKEDINEEDLETKMCVNTISEVLGSVNYARFSTFQKLLRTVSFMIRFANLLRRKNTHTTVELSVKEIREAEEYLVKRCQEECFEDELNILNGGKVLPKKSRLYKLEPFVCDAGILRVRGRIGRASASSDFRHPAILDPKHRFTHLMLDWYHRMCGHQGVRTVANEVRQKFWVIDGISAIKKTFRSCLHCQRRKCKPVETQMGDLPEFRVNTEMRPFNHTGMDYFGPLIIKYGRKNEKRWGVIFTCLTTRAVHLELVPSLTTDSTIMVIQRFSSRRGCPSHIYSDNGTNFHGAWNELKNLLKELDQIQITDKCAVKGIQWHFNPPGAPHMGGAWERLVSSVKTTMNGILKDVHPTQETLSTVLTEVESILNSRPLTDVSVDPADPVSLTPNHFLLGWTGGVQLKQVEQPIWGHIEDHGLYLRKQWRLALHLADQFWIRWKKEFLPTLTRRKKWLETGVQVKEGDIVVIFEDAGARNNWPLGRVVRVYPGKDGVVRVVDVKTSTGIYKRPVAKICRLNIHGEDEVPSSGERM